MAEGGFERVGDVEDMGEALREVVPGMACGVVGHVRVAPLDEFVNFSQRQEPSKTVPSQNVLQFGEEER